MAVAQPKPARLLKSYAMPVDRTAFAGVPSVTALKLLPRAKVLLAAARVDGRVKGRRPHVQVVRRGDTLFSLARRNGIDVDTLAALNGMQPGDALRAGQKIHVAGSSGGSAPHAHAHRRIVYTVRNGDTVAQIAQLFQCSVPQILAWNGLSSSTHLHAGQKLHIHVVRHS